MPLTIDQQVADAMIPATQEDKDYFDEVISASYFARDFLDVLKPYAYDVQPAVNSRGMRRLEGWKAVYEVTVTKGVTNFFGFMHGAAHAWLVDTCTSAAIVHNHTPQFWGQPMLGGVSVNLDMQYFNAAQIGTRLRIIVTIERINATLANLRCDISDWETGTRLSSGVHTKAWRGPKTTASL
ncbi:Acyl-coenzyme A thioesterase 13 [Vanrija pseudolonga]|uniref:Acyl-coenzyme A thioesterase 13 n=1 Tax=Vanrija pseudolonga TaxID=143232 RepID=A0AAF0Y2U9_9TREE|nr:Acyl-coenzyme A thioesterase 13 [Vanrija pseudolonga]